MVYTELEGFPLRWQYKGKVPFERRQIVSTEIKSFSVSTTPSTIMSDSESINTAQIYSNNWVSRIFRTGNNAVALSTISVYGRKVGSPPQLNMELRRIKKTGQNYVYATGALNRSVYFPSGTNNITLLEITDNLPAGKKLIIFTFIRDSATDVGFSGRLLIRKGTSTLIQSEPASYTKTKPVMIFAVDENAAGNDTYTFILQGSPGSAGTYNFHVQGIVVLLPASVFFASATSTNIAAGATVNIASVNTTFAAGSKVAVLAVIHFGVTSTTFSNRLYSAGAIRIIENATIVSSNQFQVGTGNSSFPAIVSLAFYNNNVSANPTYAVQVYNNLSETSRAWAEIVAFQVDDGAFLDTGAVASGTSPVTIGNLSTSITGEGAAIILVAGENTTTGAITIPANNIFGRISNKTFNQTSNRQGWILSATSSENRSGVLPLLRGDAISSDGFQAVAAGFGAGVNLEAKILVFKVNNSPPNFIITDDLIKLSTVSGANIGTTNAWISFDFSGIALRPNEEYVIVVYVPGGDASNYVLLGGGIGPYPPISLESSTGGGNWLMQGHGNLALRIDGVNCVQLYSGSIQNNIKHPLGDVISAFMVDVLAPSTAYFAAFDDYTYTAPIRSITTNSYTIFTILEADDPRVREPEQTAQLNYSIWAYGNGATRRAFAQRHVYMTKNPIYPTDFGFSELYLVMAEIPPKAHLAMNDNVVGGLFNDSSTETRIDAFELFRIPIRKIEVIGEPTSGNIVLYFVGLE